MTVIAWDGKTLAADRRLTHYGTIFPVQKILRTSRNVLLGASGDVSACNAMLAWYTDGADIKAFPDLKGMEGYLLAITRQETLSKPYSLLLYFNNPHPSQILSPFMALGSGKDFALSAMHCGKTAKEAVEIASLYESGCGEGVDTLEFF